MYGVCVVYAFAASPTCSVHMQYHYILKLRDIRGTMARAARTHSSVSLPLPLLEEIDKVVKAGTLGFRSRAELVAEATRAYIRDLLKVVGERERKESSKK